MTIDVYTPDNCKLVFNFLGFIGFSKSINPNKYIPFYTYRSNEIMPDQTVTLYYDKSKQMFEGVDRGNLQMSVKMPNNLSHNTLKRKINNIKNKVTENEGTQIKHLVSLKEFVMALRTMVEVDKPLKLRLFSCRSSHNDKEAPPYKPDKVQPSSGGFPGTLQTHDFGSSREKIYEKLSRLDRRTMTKKLEDPLNVYWFKQRLINFQQSPDQKKNILNQYVKLKNIEEKRKKHGPNYGRKKMAKTEEYIKKKIKNMQASKLQRQWRLTSCKRFLELEGCKRVLMSYASRLRTGKTRGPL